MNSSDIAHNLLEVISTKLESVDELEVDFDGKILSIETETGQQYLLKRT